MNQEESVGFGEKSQLKSNWINMSRNQNILVRRRQMNKEKTGGVNGSQRKPEEVGGQGK